MIANSPIDALTSSIFHSERRFDDPFPSFSSLASLNLILPALSFRLLVNVLYAFHVSSTMIAHRHTLLALVSVATPCFASFLSMCPICLIVFGSDDPKISLPPQFEKV